MGKVFPDSSIPILRHLTYREAHLFEMGVWPGASIALALYAGKAGLALSLMSGIRRRMRDKDQIDQRPDLLKGYIRDGWYFGMGAAVGFVVMLGVGAVMGLRASLGGL